MKKVLFGTTALIAAAAFAGSAQAEPIKLSIGGKQEVWFGVGGIEGSGATSYSATGMQTDTELYFTGATTLDNGITVKAVIQLEADQGGGDDADETYITMSGGFGALQLGNRQDVVMNQSWGGTSQGGQDWDEAFGWSDMGGNYVYTYYSSDDTSVGYTTPSFFGFSAAASYAPDATDRATFGDWKVGNRSKDLFAVGLAYNNEFSGVGIHADLGYWNQQGAGAAGQDNDLIRGAMALTYAGFELGGAYGVKDEPGSASDNHTWQVGAGYANGPYGVDFNYASSSGDISTTQGTASTEATVEHFKFAGKYILGPGINLTASVFHTVSDRSGTSANDSKGTAGLMGVALSF